MAFSYNYNTGAGGTANPGNVKIQNLSIGFYKKTGKVVAEFDVRGLDWADGAPYPEVKLVYGGAIKKTETLTVSDMWQRQSITWEAGKDAEDSTCQNLADLGNVTVTLRIDDEDDSTTDTAQTVDIDLDPNEYHLTKISPPSFGDDSTPDVSWSLTNLFSEQKMSPGVTVGASTATSMTVTFKEAVSPTVFASGYVNLNGVKYSESSLVMNSADAAKAYFVEASSYKITAPTMSAGDNSYTLALNCTTV